MSALTAQEDGTGRDAQFPADSTVTIADGDDGCDVGCADYDRPNPLRTGRYGGYCALGRGGRSGRVSMHDSWEDADGGCADAYSSDSENDGGFVSFWGRGSGGDEYDDGDERGSFRGGARDCGGDGDDRVETTVRPMPLLYRKRGGGLAHAAIRDPSSAFIGRWIGDGHGSRKGQGDGRGPLWGFRGGRPHGNFDGIGGDHKNHDDDEDDDANSLLASSSSSEEFGRWAPAADPALLARSPFRRDRSGGDEDCAALREEGEGIFGRGSRGEGGLLALPIVRPFLLSSRRFAEGDDALRSSDVDGESDNGVEEVDSPPRQDRAAVLRSISRGIQGGDNGSLLLNPAAGEGVGADRGSVPERVPGILRRMLNAPFFRRDDGGRAVTPAGVAQLHALLRGEDWSLAASMLQSRPELARTWHDVEGLYSGRYNGNALPIHAACALRPPPSFVREMAMLYPGCLREGDGAFGRVPLHVACRSLAGSDVIAALCDMDPGGAMERDNLKRVPLHYLIKNYCTFGEDDEDACGENITDTSRSITEGCKEGEDGMVALEILMRANPACVRAADHRGWTPIHVACSCSYRRGMIRVMRLLLEVWPEGVNAKTDKDSDLFDCVDMAGKHHPTKNRVISLLNKAKHKLLDDDGSRKVDEESRYCGQATAENNDLSKVKEKIGSSLSPEASLAVAVSLDDDSTKDSPR